jgi:hypothetical protein
MADAFYKYGRLPKLIHCSKIISMDLPFSIQGVAEVDE